MTQDEIVEMARQTGVDMSLGEHWSFFIEELEAFAKLIAEKEREKWKEIVEDQRLRLQVLNEIIGGEDSTTTGNILSYSRWEMRLEDAVKEEREACAKIVEESCLPDTYSEECLPDIANEIRARGTRMDDLFKPHQCPRCFGLFDVGNKVWNDGGTVYHLMCWINKTKEKNP